MKSILFLLVALSIVSVSMPSVFANTYMGVYPDESKRDPTYVYQTCDFGPTTSSVDDDVYCIVSSAGQTSGNAHSGYMMQNFVEYRDSDNHLHFNSEAWGITDDMGTIKVLQSYDCEVGGGCIDLGTESSIDYIKTIQYWNSTDVSFYAEKYPNVGSSTGHYNTHYDPIADDASANFQSGHEHISGGPIVKLTQWGIEGPDDATNFEFKQHEMFTWSPTKQFEDDTAITVDPDNTGNYKSVIMYRVIGGFGYSASVVGTGDAYCVERTNNVDGEIVWEDTTTNCESAGTTFWP